MPTSNPSTTPSTTPFIVLHEHRDESMGHATPAAHLVITPVLKASGLLKQMTDTDAKSLLALLSFITPNGFIRVTAHQIAEAIGTSDAEAQDRMATLTRQLWEEEPLVLALTEQEGNSVEHEDHIIGHEVYTLHPKAVAHVLPPPSLPDAPEPLPFAPAGRTAVIAASRAKYARPRAEVEQEIEVALGHPEVESEDSLEGEIRRRLLAVGVSRDQVQELVEECPLEDIQRQLDWLPARGANSPSRFIVAAIRGNYSAPNTQRNKQRDVSRSRQETFRNPPHGFMNHHASHQANGWSHPNDTMGEEGNDAPFLVTKDNDAPFPSDIDTFLSGQESLNPDGEILSLDELREAQDAIREDIL
jgi:hypothetical protein